MPYDTASCFSVIGQKRGERSVPREHLDSPQDVVYLAKHPFYEVALTKSMSSCPHPGVEPPLVRLWFKGEPHQLGIACSLATLERFHDALSQLLDYVQQERAGGAERRGGL
jgi:hypothetical protein